MNFPPQVLNTWAPNPTPARGSRFNISANANGSVLMYPSGKALVLRSFETPSLAVVYTARRPISACVFSHKDPNFLVCTEQTGSIHQLKLNSGILSPETQLQNTKEFNIMGIGGQIHDICFLGDDKNLLAGGDSAGKNGRVFSLSGATLGGDNNTNLGSAKRILTVAAPNTLPTKKSVLFTGTEDFKMKPYLPARGGSFKINAGATIKHSGMVNMIRYHPEDLCVLSCGGKDLMIHAFNPDAEPADQSFGVLQKIKGGVKDGRVYALAWSMDAGSQNEFMRVGTDKVVKIYDSSTGAETVSYDLSGSSFHKEKVNDFQVACTYAGKYPVSMNLAGDLIYFDTRTPKPTRFVSGTTAPIADVSFDAKDDTLGVVSTKGEMLLYSGIGSGDVNVVRSKGMAASKSGVGVFKSGGDLLTTSNSDTLQRSILEGTELTLQNGDVPLGGKPMYMRRADDTKVTVATINSVLIVEGTKVLATFDKNSNGMRDTDITCAALSPDLSLLAVGYRNRAIEFYNCDLPGKKFTKREADTFNLLENYGFVNSMSFHSSGKYLAIGCAKCIKLYEITGSGLKIRSGENMELWEGHTAKVMDVDFGGPGGMWLLSSETNTRVCLWDVSKFEDAKPQKLDRPHGTGFVNRVRWVSENEFITVGQEEGAMKKWKI